MQHCFSSDSRFTQQELPACKPILTPKWVNIPGRLHVPLILSAFIEYIPNNAPSFISLVQVIGTFLLVSVVFIPIGVVSLFASRDVCFEFIVIYFLLPYHFLLICFTDKFLYVHQVVEIVDRYETDCIPLPLRNDKVGFIQSNSTKTCQRTLRVSHLFGKYDFGV